MDFSISRRSDWRVSLHGGHSGEFCEHAGGRLHEVLESALAAGFSCYGVSEHAPRQEERFLYPSERDKGFTVERLESDFSAYSERIDQLIREFADRIPILKGFEAEVVPSDGYREIMLGYRRRHGFDYMVGSVHHVGEIQIDGSKEEFEQALEAFSGLEGLAVAYYRGVAQMVDELRPEVVGHLDVIRKNGIAHGTVESSRVLRAAEEALEVIRQRSSILDLNTAGYRKGLGQPYPSPILVQRAHAMEIPFCFGDDSHGPPDVGAGIEQARDYLLQNGVGQIQILIREEGGIGRRWVSLE